MKKLFVLLTLILAGSSSLFAQQLTCGDSLIDSGGSTAEYTNSEADTFYICPQNPGEAIELTFLSFDTEQGYDFLTIYDGNQAGVNPIGTFSGTQTLGSFVSENQTGCLTVVFTSDGSVTASGWVASIACVAAPTCFKPSNLQVNNVTANAGTFSWQANDNEVRWVLEYGPSGFTPGTGTSVVSLTNPATISTFTDLTNYDMYVRARCGIGDTSAYFGPINFTTLPAPLNCGDVFTDSGNDTSNYQVDENYVFVACPGVPTETVQVIFSEFQIEDGYDFMTIYDANDTIPGTEIGVFTGGVSPGTIVAENSTGCLTFYFTSDVIIADSGWVATINCVPAITCPRPINLQVDSTSSSSATLSWTSNGAETQWLIEYDTTGFVLGTGTTIVANSNPFEITGLNAATNYEFYVSAICSSTDSSYTTGPISMTTNLAPFICGNLFLDNGGANDYANSSNDTTTICPNGSFEFVSVIFSSFNTEQNYDSLMIYNGSSTSDPLIGIFQGNLLDSMGTITSTNANGCLTFVFESDGSVVYEGWSAQIACIDGNAQIAENQINYVSVYPNPSNGKFTVQNTQSSIINLELRDMQGRKLNLNKSNLASKENTVLDLSAYQNGMYFLVINGNQTISLVKN